MDGLEERKQVFIMGATNRPGTYSDESILPMAHVFIISMIMQA
jgi:SpoVK/Ycf46/Vps4 family AAA+-type ATPase